MNRVEHSLGIAIIGAGITGLTAADHLVKSGREVHVFDKGRGAGGRIATRRTPNGVFDHGAPELQAESQEFRDFLAALGAIVGECGSNFGAPGMRSIFDQLISKLDIHQGAEVTAIDRESGGLGLHFADGRLVAPFDTVLVTAPAPQARTLVAPVAREIAAEIEKVRMQPIWSCLVEFSEPLALEGKSEGRGAVLRADRMASKPLRNDPREAWVIHMRPEFACDQLFADRAIVACSIIEAFGDAYGLTLPQVRYLEAHRWRYAFADQPLGRPFVGDAGNRLLVGGDWTLGGRAEHGFQSGRAMANAVLSREVVKV